MREVLDRIDKRNRRHRVLTDHCHENAVHDIVECPGDHRYDDRDSHRKQQRDNWFFFHVGLIHFSISIPFFIFHFS